MAKIVAGSNTARLAEEISSLTGIPILEKTVRKFPDGETYVRLDSGVIKNEKVFIVHSLYPEQNENLIELFLTIGAVREFGAHPVPVIPYFAYGRQDKAFQEGEALSLKTVFNIIRSLGAEEIITVDAHFHRKEGSFNLFGIKVRNLSAVTLQITHAEKVIKDGFVIAGPDEGSHDFLYGARDAVFLGKEKYCPVCGKPATRCRCKNRRKEYAIRTTVPEDLVNKNILLLDDMITSGSTIIEAVKALKAKRNRIYVGCTHGLFVGDSLSIIKSISDGIFCADTVETEASKIHVSSMLAEEIKKL